MCSSKFSAPKLAYKIPVVCKPPPPPITLIAPPTLPLQLQASVSDKDYDPLAWREDSQRFPLQKIPGQNAYFGRSAPAGDRYELTLTRLADPNYWNLTLDIFDPYRQPETFSFPNRYVDSSKPFDTHLIYEEHIPGLDFRALRILE